MNNQVQISLKPGKYIICVSGGVDSMVLLSLAAELPDVQLVVAHFDHGMRPESAVDAEFVASYARSLGLLFELGHGELGSGASEATARCARYIFLQLCRKKHNGDALVMAHHQDDVIETIILNIIRGTGWRGLSSLRSHPHLLRPLLTFTKQQIIEVAKVRRLSWYEDISNDDQKYRRNYIRHQLIPKIRQKDSQFEKTLLRLSRRQQKLNSLIEPEVKAILAKNATSLGRAVTLGRYFMIMCPKEVAIEVLQAVSEQLVGTRLQLPIAQRALLFCKTGRSGTRMSPNKALQLRVTNNQLIVEVAPGMVS